MTTTRNPRSVIVDGVRVTAAALLREYDRSDTPSHLGEDARRTDAVRQAVRAAVARQYTDYRGAEIIGVCLDSRTPRYVADPYEVYRLSIRCGPDSTWRPGVIGGTPIVRGWHTRRESEYQDARALLDRALTERA